jgi:quercetin dioxygenase-like cupin family protein
LENRSFLLNPSQPAPPSTCHEQLATFSLKWPGAVERKKKTIASPSGLQMFLLYVRADGQVPLHQVTGAITVHTLIGNATLTVNDRSYVLAPGNVLPIAAGAPHSVSADRESVLLITHALRP